MKLIVFVVIILFHSISFAASSDFVSSADTYITGSTYSSQDDTNYGNAIDLQITDGNWLFNEDGPKRTILNFDFSSLDDAATISNATLKLYYYDWDNSNPSGKQVDVFRIVRTDWVELEATWNIYKTGNNWTTAGASDDGNDHDTTDGANTTMPGSYGLVEWDVTDIVVYAQNNTSEIAYFFVKFNDETKTTTNISSAQFQAVDWGGSFPPKLTITYSTHWPQVMNTVDTPGAVNTIPGSDIKGINTIEN